uniref:Uncharacterized protein n=1 Tax=Storeatula sp. CCMP1868 TaxID=195070 RepID=A0A222AHR7_9CRYP|nr:hypothetical protein [Storeatula sp. CCMP1868]
MSNILEQINQLLSPPGFHFINMQTDQDPVTKLLSSLHSCRGIEVNIKGQDDVFIEDFFQNSKRNTVQVNVDEDLKLFSKPTRVPNAFSNQRQSEFPTQQQKAIISKLKNIPVYTVINGYNEIVVASPRVMPPKNSLEWLYDKYYENFLWTKDKGAISLGLFFVNREDAETYMQEVCKKDPKGAETIGLSVKSIGLDKFYELNRTSKPKMQARLVGDLEEIDLLLNEYLTNNSLDLHPKQKYKKHWFQGNPVYLIKVNERINEVNKKKFTLSKYNFDNSFGNYRKILLFSRDDAYRVWNLYRLKNPDLKLPEFPALEVYNLENYLLDLEKSDIELTEQTTFVPPYNSYQYSKSLVEISNNENNISIKEKLEQYINTKAKSLQRFYKGLVWLITSDTLPSEDNAW